MNDFRYDLQEVFRRIFDNDELEINEATTAADVEGWDSMAHINLMIAIEKHFGVKFSGSDLAAMQGDGKNIGVLMELLAKKIDSRGSRA
jgi:acyl carrier protein